MEKNVRELFDDLSKKVNEVNLLKDASENLIKKLDKEKKDHEKLVEMMRNYPIGEDNENDIVCFNVGGQVFATFKSTLNKKIKKIDANNSNDDEEYYDPNLLHGLLSGLAKVKLDKNGAVFIDRNPKYFNLILDYLRLSNINEDCQKTLMAY